MPMPRPLKGRLAAVIAPAATMSPARRCWISRPDSLRLLTSSTRCPLVRIVHELTRLRAGLLVGYIERGGVAFEAVDAGTSPQEARGGECQASQRRRQDTPQSLSGDHWQALCRGAGLVEYLVHNATLWGARSQARNRYLLETYAN